MMRWIAMTGFLLASSAGAYAQQPQEPFNLNAPVRNLATLFTDLFGPRGLIVDSLATLPGEQPHTAHFNSDFQFNFTQFGTALVGQLVSVPLPSPAGGFTFQFDPTLGVFRRTTQSFGPILAERADTIGARRVSVGYAYQRFSYDSVEGIDLRSVPAVFTHDNAALLGGREDVVVTTNSIEAVVNQSTMFVTFGITDAMDVSLAVPYVLAHLKVVSDATIHRLGTVNELTHFYRQANGEVGDRRIFTAVGDASGIGDLQIRVKSTVARRESSAFALGANVRLPTGDEMNLLGSGAPGLQPFVLWSGTYGKLSPHVNVSYRWNGSSVLAGNPATGESAHFPDQLNYAFGSEIGVNERLTLAFDLLGTYVIDASRLRAQTFHALDGESSFPNIGFTRESFNAISGSIGVKADLIQRLLLHVNLLFKADEHGLRDKVTPLLGLEYTF
jgi:hypothetical protein